MVLLIAPTPGGVAPADEWAIRHVMMATWDKPGARLEVLPVIVLVWVDGAGPDDGVTGGANANSPET